MRILYLGDIHGNFNLVNQYLKLYKIKNAHIIQVGDFGVGFNTFIKEKRLLEMTHKELVKNNVFLWVIRGNHDYKPYFDNDPFGFTNIKLIKDYDVLKLEGKNILCIGGAVSVDRVLNYTKAQRNKDYTKTLIGNERWWPDEVFVLDTEKLGKVRDINIVVTHTCPDYCPPDNKMGIGPFVEGMIKNTGDNELRMDLAVERKEMTDAFTIIKMNNNIDLHFYGHFHRNDTLDIYGTKHRVLGIGELWEERDKN